jgi:hypothetical protein
LAQLASAPLPEALVRHDGRRRGVGRSILASTLSRATHEEIQGQNDRGDQAIPNTPVEVLKMVEVR